MKSLLFLVFVAVGATVSYHVVFPSPRLTFGDNGSDQWTAACFAPDGKTIVARGYREKSRLGPPYDSVLKLWDASTGKLIREYQPADKDSAQQIDRVGFSADAKYVLAGGYVRPLGMWETESGKEIRAWPKESKSIARFAITPDGSQLLGADSSSNLGLLELKTGKSLKARDLRDSYGVFQVGDILFSKDGKYFVLCDSGIVTIWDFSKFEMLHCSTWDNELQVKQFYLPLFALKGITLAPDGQGILICTTKGKIIELDLATAKAKRTFELKTDRDIHVLAISPKGDKIMTTGFHGRTVVYSFPECKELKRMPGYGRVQFSPDGKTALTFTKNGRMMLWDLEK